MSLSWAIPAAWLPLLALIAVAAALWVRRHYLATEPLAPRGVRRLLAGLRTAAVLLLLAAIAGPRLQLSGDVALPPEALIIVEDSGSMGLRDDPDGPDRWGRAQAWVARSESLLSRLEPPVRTTVLRGNGLGALGPLSFGGDPPAAVGTDLNGLAAAAARGWTARNLRAMLVVTDGQETQSAAEGPVAPADGALPVLIGVGDPAGPADLEVMDVRHPDTAFVGDKIVVEAVVGLRGLPRREERRLRLTLVQGADTLAAVTATAGPDDPVLRAELGFVPRVAGLQVARLVVAPLVNERYLANNEVSLAVAVRQDREKLLLVAGRPDWNVRMFAQAAALERRLTLEVVHPGERGPVLNGAPWTPPRGAAQWQAWDGVIVVGEAGFPAGFDAAGLAAAVTDGLGLLVVGGRLGGLPQALADLLPVELRGAAGEAGGGLQVRREETGHSLLSGLPFEAAAWSWLPPLGRVVGARARPGARVLLTIPGRGGAGDAPLLAIVAAGEGTVTWLGTDELWTLAFWQPPLSAGELTEHPARRLARNLLVWAAAGDDLGGVTIAGHRTLYREGEAIRMETQVRGLRGEGTPGAIALELLDEASSAVPRSFSPIAVPGEVGRGRVTLPPQAPGRYRIRPVAVGTDSALGPEREFVVIAARPEEAQVRQDRRRLRALATAWGGQYVDGHAPGAGRALSGILGAADWSPVTVARRSEIRLVHGWFLIVAATLLLGVEWAVRRARGML